MHQKKSVKNIQKMFDCLREHNLKLKWSKCTFMQKETWCPGFIISEDGIMAHPDKVKVMRQILSPTCVREVRSFLGMCSYYRRFIPNFSAIAKPCIRLTEKFAKFEWNKKCQATFDFLKQSLTTVPVLAYPDTCKPQFSIQMLVMIVLGHVYAKSRIYKEMKSNEVNEEPIHYLSNKLTASQTKWPRIEKEAFAIFFALQKLEQYLHDCEFVIRRDHRPLKYIMDSPVQKKKDSILDHKHPWLQL